MNTIHEVIYRSQANFIYSKTFTDRFIGWLFTSRKAQALTFLRKYTHDLDSKGFSCDRHEDVTEFILNKLPKLLVEEPELFASDVWTDSTALHANTRARLFTIYKNYSIDRWKGYKTINKYETTKDLTMITTASPNVDVVRAMVYRRVWNDYTAELTSIDKIIALYLLDGSISLKQLEVSTGLKKSALYIRMEKIQNEIAKLTEGEMANV